MNSFTMYALTDSCSASHEERNTFRTLQIINVNLDYTQLTIYILYTFIHLNPKPYIYIYTHTHTHTYLCIIHSLHSLHFWIIPIVIE